MAIVLNFSRKVNSDLVFQQSRPHYIPFHEIIIFVMVDQFNYFKIETFWELLLSREEKQVKNAFARLSEEEQDAVLNHLKSMAQDPGWHTEQRISAQFALSVLEHTEE